MLDFLYLLETIGASYLLPQVHKLGSKFILVVHRMLSSGNSPQNCALGQLVDLCIGLARTDLSNMLSDPMHIPAWLDLANKPRLI